MAFFKFFFYVIFYLLIKLGETVYAFISEIANFIALPFLFLNKRVKRYSSQKVNVKKKQTREIEKTISLNNNKLFDFFSKNFKFAASGIRKGIVFVLILVRKVALFILSILYSPLMILRFLVHFKFGQRRRGRPRLPVKTTFFYKVKYIFVGSIFAFFLFFLPATFFIFIADLPKISNLSVNYISKSTKILDRHGTLLFEIYANQNRTIVELEQVPIALRQATIAIEDKDFYNHSGFDIRGILRALYVDVTKDDLQGGSTITQQLVKSALLTPEISITRKARELVLAMWAEQKYSKDQILELYFNYVPYGGTAWGVEAASQIFFGRHVSELNLAESAYLAGLPQAPSQYSPFNGDGNLGKRRQKDVLKAMVDQGYITKTQADKAYAERLIFESPQVPIQAPHFVMYVKDLLVRKYGLLAVERGGLYVTTSLDLGMQKQAELIVSDEVEKGGYLGVGNGASLITNPQNGDILAMIGSRDYFDPEHDGNVNITTSLRQPGSTIKLITYAMALSEGLSEATVIDDQPLTIRYEGSPSYSPVNYDGKYHGRVPLRIAFANSFNIPAVKLAQRFGVEKIVDYGKRMGIASWGSADKYGISITLGAAEVTMLDLATAYGTVANSGSRVDLDPILQVVDSEGKVLEKKEIIENPVLDPGVSYILADILSDNKARSIAFGTNSPLTIKDKKISVKTGTTDNKRDNWTIGFAPDLLVVTWVGNNDNTPLSPALSSGITGAAPMWNRIMTALLEDKASLLEMEIPENLVPRQCYGYTAYFVRGTETSACRRLQAPSPTLQQQ